MSKEDIRSYAMSLGADAVGFAAIEDYRSKKSPDPKTILPTGKSLVVIAYRELDGSVESANSRTCMSGRMAIMELSQKNVYLTGRYVEDKYHAKTAPVLLSYPLDMGPGVMGLIGDISLRHAAVAAGLGVFGRNNLVLHPRFGSRILFTALLTDLALPSDPPVTEELCNNCGLCVENCPAKALEVEGQTDALKCLRHSQPWGIGSAIGFVLKFTKAPPGKAAGDAQGPPVPEALPGLVYRFPVRLLPLSGRLPRREQTLNRCYDSACSYRNYLSHRDAFISIEAREGP